MKVVFASAATILMLAAPACAQSKASMPTPEQMMYGKTPDQIEKEQSADRAYKESLKKIPDAKAPSDPWGSARSADAKAPAVKRPPAKRGNAAN